MFQAQVACNVTFVSSFEHGSCSAYWFATLTLLFARQKDRDFFWGEDIHHILLLENQISICLSREKDNSAFEQDVVAHVMVLTEERVYPQINSHSSLDRVVVAQGAMSLLM